MTNRMPRGSASRERSGEPTGSGHAQRISRLFSEHNESLIQFLATRLRSVQEAKEVAQEAYVRLLSLEDSGAVSFLRAFLFKTAANLAVDRHPQPQSPAAGARCRLVRRLPRSAHAGSGSRARAGSGDRSAPDRRAAAEVPARLSPAPGARRRVLGDRERDGAVRAHGSSLRAASGALLPRRARCGAELQGVGTWLAETAKAHEHDSVLQEAAQWSLELSTGDISCGTDRSVAAVAGCERGSSRSLRSHPVDLVRDRSVRNGELSRGRPMRRSRAMPMMARFPSLSGGHERRRNAAVAAAELGRRFASPTLADGRLGRQCRRGSAALVALPVIRSMQFAPPVVTVVETASGENRDVPLGDGSIVSAGAHSVLWATLIDDRAKSRSSAARLSFASRRIRRARSSSRSAPRPSRPWAPLSMFGARASASSSAWPRES